jgi:hypothetical protein
MIKTDWRLAQCSEIGLEPFTDYEVTRGNRALGRFARKVCSGCPVFVECANEALDLEDTGVIRAGIAIGDAQTRTVRSALEFSAANGYPPKDQETAKAWGAEHGVRSLPNTGVAHPDPLPLKPRDQVEYEVLALTKLGYGEEATAMRLDLKLTSVMHIKRKWVKSGRLTKEELRASIMKRGKQYDWDN